MKMDPLCQDRQGLGLGTAGYELLDIITALQMEGSGELTIYWMVNHHIQHHTAIIYHDIQLLLHICSRMAASRLPQKACPASPDHIPPGRGINGFPGSPEQCHISYDDLTAHPILLRQGSGTHRLWRPAQCLPDCSPALLCCNGTISSSSSGDPPPLFYHCSTLLLLEQPIPPYMKNLILLPVF